MSKLRSSKIQNRRPIAPTRFWRAHATEHFPRPGPAGPVKAQLSARSGLAEWPRACPAQLFLSILFESVLSETEGGGYTQGMTVKTDEKLETAFLELREGILFEMIERSLYPELARDYQVTGLAKIEDGRYVLRLGRKLDLGFNELAIQNYPRSWHAGVPMNRVRINWSSYKKRS
jgi:hypothetical protein